MKNLIYLFLLLFFLQGPVQAQKLPNVQKQSLRIPNNLKIDGLADEWGNNFAAYNHATDLAYTVANNDTMLYFIIKASDMQTIYKILNSGMVLTINTNSKNKTKGVMQIAYPLFGRKNYPMIELRDNPQLNKKMVTNTAKVDSFRISINKELAKRDREIKVQGLQSVPDQIMSIFNTYSISVSESFDRMFNYNIEFQIPLAYLNMNIKRTTPFYYNITVIGANSSLPINTRITVSIIKPQHMGALYDTDFWGGYILAK